MLRTKTFEIHSGQVSVTVRESTGMDMVDSQLVYGKLSYRRDSERERNRARNFTNALLRSQVSGDLGYSWPDLDAASVPEGQYQTAFEGWQQLGTDDLANWQNALTEVNSPPLEPAPPTKAHSKKSSDG